MLRLPELELELRGAELVGVVVLGGIELGVVEIVVGGDDDTDETGGDEETAEGVEGIVVDSTCSDNDVDSNTGRDIRLYQLAGWLIVRGRSQWQADKEETRQE